MRYSWASKFISNGLLPVALLAFSCAAQDDLWREAQREFRDARYAKAEALYRQFVQANPDIPQAWANLGLALHMQKKQTEAIAAFERSLKLDDGVAHAHLFLGINRFNRDEIQPARIALENYIRLVPNDAQGHYYLGLTFISDENFEVAGQALAKASQFAPKDVDILYHLAQSYIGRANILVKEAAAEDPSIPIVRAWAKAQPDTADLATISVDEAATRDSLRSLPQPLSGNDRQRAAIAYANLYLATTKRFYELAPDSFRVHQLLAAHYERAYQTDKAIEELKKAIAKSSSTRGLHLSLGAIYLDKGNPEMAIDEFLAELNLASPDAATRRQLARAYLTLHEPQKALDQLLIESKKRTDGPLLRMLGRTYAALGRDAEAVDTYLKAIAAGERDRPIWYQLAQTYRRMGKTEDARRAFAEAAKAVQLKHERADP